MKKISIIIPNYNNARCIERCLDSVAKQEYSQKEIIVVDDGSDDDSVFKIKNFIKLNKSLDIQLICQSNLNGAIARNKGMSVATGHYVFFLDSDDVLEDGALSSMVVACEESGAELVIGNYKTVDSSHNADINKNELFFDKSEILDVKSNFKKLMNMSPVPSNKLYNLKIIKDNGLEWGNVRIGQDLNFYLKYLLLCNKVVFVDELIYQHRLSKRSMTRAYDFRIFDIVYSFNDIERFYAHNKEELLFKKYIPVLELRHFSYQISKSVYFENRQDRSLVVRYFSIAEKGIDYSSCVKENRRLRLRFRLKCFLRPLYVSKLYCLYKNKRRGEKS